MDRASRKWIQIPEPCHEDWNRMASLGDGTRRCERCQHAVRDFTPLSDAEVRFQVIEQGAHCGRFTTSQLARLNRPPRPSAPVRPSFSLASLSLTGLLVAGGGAWLASAEEAAAPAAQSEPVSRPKPGERARPQQPPPVAWIKGQVFDARHRQPLPGVLISVQGSRRQAVSDENGRFELGLGTRVGYQENVVLLAEIWGFTSMSFEADRSGWDRVVMDLWPAEEEVHFTAGVILVAEAAPEAEEP
ncbi:MAG TPA: carboxypeptidase-like regulatory domain-containing protein [Thermoanaerobaculia bacterium]|nr:carboxypeptidase-like regulatory domain-containing protein [Thermoanaerobaculia bacterium]